MIPRLSWARLGVTVERIDIYMLAEALPRYECAFLRTPYERRISTWPKFELGFYGAAHNPAKRKKARRVS